ncbi:ATPase [Pseudomonas cavernae]|uniref:ATPase n=1 Tax=Pseudomonas cavernae TaxID=2320867 RepID=A0A385Z4T0_9PSED|nr:ATPase [Pseudomonas cavernae]AYC34146.1 ATPase [Pseudomonas cavernae]
MRNDTLDELDSLPSLTTDARDHSFAGKAGLHEHDYAADARHSGRAAPAVVKSASTGPLWALVGALVIALGGLGWWSHQQIELMSQQLVATQESFARISEEAAGRIQDISGKVVATESNVTTGSEALRLQVKQLGGKLAELNRQMQSLTSQQGGSGKRFEQLSGDLKAQQEVAGKLDAKLQSLANEQSALKSAQGEQGKLAAQLKALDGEIAALQKQGNPNAAIDRLEQDLLVLRSEQDNRPAPSTNTAEFDAFRAQTTRNISALQAQMQNLQQQLSARP